jgi:hypothetical protein
LTIRPKATASRAQPETAACQLSLFWDDIARVVKSYRRPAATALLKMAVNLQKSAGRHGRPLRLIDSADDTLRARGTPQLEVAVCDFKIVISLIFK